MHKLIVDPRAEHQAPVVWWSLEAMLDDFEAGRAEKPQTYVIRNLEDEADYSPFLFQFIQNLTGWAVMVDEVDQYCNPNRIDPELQRLMNGQRHYQVELIFAARRPAAVHRDVTALASDVYLFHAHEPRDLAYIRETCGQKFAEQVYNLPFYKYLHIQFPIMLT